MMIESLADQNLHGQSVRFVLFGVANTALTYLLYCALVFAMHPQFAYAVAFVAGIGLAWLGNSRFVFRQPLSRKTASIYPLLYGAQYLLTAVMIHMLTVEFAIGPRVALALALLVTTPLSFLWNRALLVRKPKPG